MERKDFQYDAALAGRYDVGIALRLHSEYVRKFSPSPPPKFFEVDITTAKIDDLWHFSLDSRTTFKRTLDVPAIVKLERPDWRLTKVGLAPQQKTTFWLGNLILQELDYFPARGDFVFYNGYRQIIVNVVIAPEAIWNQTNVWLGMVVTGIIPAEGDAKPLANVGEAVPAELIQTRPLAEA